MKIVLEKLRAACKISPSSQHGAEASLPIQSPAVLKAVLFFFFQECKLIKISGFCLDSVIYEHGSLSAVPAYGLQSHIWGYTEEPPAHPAITWSYKKMTSQLSADFNKVWSPPIPPPLPPLPCICIFANTGPFLFAPTKADPSRGEGSHSPSGPSLSLPCRMVTKKKRKGQGKKAYSPRTQSYRVPAC